MASDEQLEKFKDEILKELRDIKGQLKELNGSVARHSHTLYGVNEYGGLTRDVKRLFREVESISERLKVPGTVRTNTMWKAIGAIAAVSAVFVSLMIGLQ